MGVLEGIPTAPKSPAKPLAYFPAESKRSRFEKFDRRVVAAPEINFYHADYPFDFVKSDASGRHLADEIHLRGVWIRDG